MASPDMYPLGFPFQPEVKMSVRKAVSLVVSLSVLALAACSDVTGPQPEGFCGVTGGPGTCVAAAQN